MIKTSVLARARALPVAVAAFVAIGWCSTGLAEAAISSFILSPTSGPPGTVVAVSGTGCSPGLTLSAASDYVAIAAPSLQVSMQVPVAATGSWHGSFTVPADANAGLDAPVVALCVTDGLPSFTTLYTPQTFTVTAPSAPTTTTRGGTSPTTTPTTKPPKDPGGTTTPTTNGATPDPDGGSGPGSRVPVFGGFPPDGSDANSGGGGSGNARSGPIKADVSRATRGAPAARAADLSTPGFPVARVSGSAGLGWVAWLLFLALVSAAVAGPLWMRRSRERDDDVVTAGGAR